MELLNSKEELNYGEILFIGKCNYKCYYCICNEMKKMQKNKEIYNNQHFSNWRNFEQFLSRLEAANCQTIYLSSTSSEPFYISILMNLLIIYLIEDLN